MIEPSIFSLDRLVTELVHVENRPWCRHVEIIRYYVPPRAKPGSKPMCVVRYTGGEEEGFLRYSLGPRQGHFWDIYGEDYLSPELALIALLQAPPPPVRYSMVFTLPRPK